MRAVAGGDRRRSAEQAIYIAALFEGAGRFLMGAGAAARGVPGLEREEGARS